MTWTSVNPMNDAVLATMDETTPQELEDALAAAWAAAPVLRAMSAADRGRWIRAVADALDRRSDELVRLARSETGLPDARLTGEVIRTTTQLRFLAEHAETGQPFEPTIDRSDRSWVPAPRPDLRSVRTGIGVVLVFAASNFPFAFSVAGGDTASAWAAGCPVIVKTHPGHPLLSEAVAETIKDALATQRVPPGAFAAVRGFDVGVAALNDCRVSAGAFTGSVAGGHALADIASRRKNPIPFFAEMGSVNPVIVTARASRERADWIAAGLADSFLLGTGQFCTKPGLILIPAGSGITERLAALIADRPAGVMLHRAIRDRHRTAMRDFLAHGEIGLVATGQQVPDDRGAFEASTVASTTAKALIADPGTIAEEHFGPSTVLVTYESESELEAAIQALPGTLTGTVHRGSGEDVAGLVAALAERAGRVLVDDWPTGVAITWAQFHGGPYPATSDTRHTSVGAGAISRFLRTIAYQNVPDNALPRSLRDANPDRLLRQVDGTLTNEPIGEGP
ncbi:aldehyde dehydrogenase (NADP(+)) [Streptomyces sp. NBC_00873]|uniref:aldehyde dehydrogenase (NADP(+)) n=1 Tax=unclassified Streptomyces TaxID=2593676 RepID=UPI0038705340|nr:aldehyde dehydrogenase (NADP(+)) [Streptomyces sp. NBC_00873]WTA41664.1 aldehyde dehydrogenase (NADP(+)) [Streptomyces sp. NBC_00842]